ncbi:MAG: helix-turn-helix transcriptional regulator [Chloroflexaceae bacterium]|nr:helix-turn-helix transcriptional regulator [Chloroflexaceae bacterium]
MVQTQLAHHLALATHTHISQLEAHKTTPSLHLIVRVALFFGVTIDYLIRDDIPIKTPTRSGNPQEDTGDSHWYLLGKKLRMLRRKRNLTQRDVAKAVGLAAQVHMSYLESGRKEPSIDLLLRIADFFGVSTDYLLRDDIPVTVAPPAQDAGS